MTDYDSPWKEALDVFFEPFMAFFFPEAHQAIDWSRGYEPLDKELQQIAVKSEVGRKYVDKLTKVWLKDGQEQWLLLHIEVQSTKDADFEVRMYTYNYRLFDKYKRQVISLAVLGDEDPAWRPHRFRQERLGCKIDFEFPVAKLLDYEERFEELERHENLFAPVVAAHLDALRTRSNAQERRKAKVRLFQRFSGRKMEIYELRQLLRSIDWMMVLPEPEAIIFEKEMETYEKEVGVPFISVFERIAAKRVAARAEAEGKAEGLANAIEKVLVKKFGDETNVLMTSIRRLTDLDKLSAIFDAAISDATLDELRSQL